MKYVKYAVLGQLHNILGRVLTLTYHHLCRNVCRSGQLVLHGSEGRPNRYKNRIHTLSSSICVDTIPKDTDDHAEDYHNVGEMETKGSSTLYRITYTVLGTHQTIRCDSDSDEEVTHCNEAEGSFP
jgi:hypothetical protein